LSDNKPEDPLAEIALDEDAIIDFALGPMEWLASLHVVRMAGDDEMKCTLQSSCLVHDAEFISAHVRRDADEDGESCVEAAISAVCQSTALLFHFVAKERLTENQLRVKIKEFLTR